MAVSEFVGNLGDAVNLGKDVDEGVQVAFHYDQDP